jgi:hypothetical protein
LVYETVPDSTEELPPDDPVSIFDAPNYNAAGIDFNDLDRKTKTVATALAPTPTVAPAAPVG